MLINYVPLEESRIAIVEDGRLEEFYQERASSGSHVGNIYKGRVVNIEPSIQAVFVDFGLDRNGFLHISDLHPMYFPGKDREEFERVGLKTPRRDRPPIQRCLSRGQDILVQVLKEGIGTKGPTLTSYLSIPGRFLVMMPHMQRMGVSRKVDDDDARREMRKILSELKPPDDFGFIIRTAGIGQTKTDLKRDLAYLQRLWRAIEHRRKSLNGVGELYTESDLVIRTIRDVFTSDIKRIVVDNPNAARRAHEFLKIANPRARSKVVYYDDPVPLFHRFEIEQQIENIHSRTVPLPSGGSLIIDQTEALVAIDVNSGKSRDAHDAETNAFKTNTEAIDEICRQLRLRDLGGVVINDLIDMRTPKHRRQIEARFRQNLKKDRARTRIGNISQFGILEMTRQRMRPSLKTSIYAECPRCGGTGHTKSPESVVLDVMRRLALVMQLNNVGRIELTISPDVAFQLLNRKRTQLVQMEQRSKKQVLVRVGGQTIDYVDINAFDERGGVINTDWVRGMDHITPPVKDAFKELDKLPAQSEPKPPPKTPAEPQKMEAAKPETVKNAQPVTVAENGENGATRKRRRRRAGKGRKKKTDEQNGRDHDNNAKIKSAVQKPPADKQSDRTQPLPTNRPPEPAKQTGAGSESNGSDQNNHAGQNNDNKQWKKKPPFQSPWAQQQSARKNAATESNSASPTSDSSDSKSQNADTAAPRPSGNGQSKFASQSQREQSSRSRQKYKRKTRKPAAQTARDGQKTVSAGSGYSNKLLDDASPGKG